VPAAAGEGVWQVNRLFSMAVTMVAATALLALAACNGDDQVAGVPGEDTVTEDNLRLQISTDRDDYEVGDAVHFRLKAENTGNDLLILRFPTGQRFDFQVTDQRGNTLWSYSEGRVFTQAVGEVELAPGQTVEFSEEWEAEESGTYIVRGWLTTFEAEPRVQTTFTVD
jgi:hypothetical protein